MRSSHGPAEVVPGRKVSLASHSVTATLSFVSNKHQRTQRTQVAQQTLQIIEQGRYVAPDGSDVSVAAQLAACVAGTRLYADRELASLPAPPAPDAQRGPSKIELSRETSLSAIRRLATAPDARPLCLNFASAKNPGGGFIGGAEAQEESLARASGLYASLISQQQYYSANRAYRSAFYTEHMIYSPDVPMFRDDSGALLNRPHLAAFITAPAVNAGVVQERERERVSEIAEVMRRRIERVLGIALGSGHRALVLGAWGCGVFRNEPSMVAQLFAEALQGPFKDRFAHVVFAVFDRAAGQPCWRAFQEQLSGLAEHA